MNEFSERGSLHSQGGGNLTSVLIIHSLLALILATTVNGLFVVNVLAT
jgi:hypothetical protein